MSKYIDAATYKLIKNTIPIVCVDLLIIKEGKVLLLKRKNPPMSGQWWYPGGRILKDETILDAARRKGKEELDIMLEPQNIISVEESLFNLQNDEVDIHTINIVVQMKILHPDFNIRLDNNHTDYKWFSEISIPLHPAVENPLRKINIRFKEK